MRMKDKINVSERKQSVLNEVYRREGDQFMDDENYKDAIEAYSTVRIFILKSAIHHSSMTQW